MKITILGGTGWLGAEIAVEATSRGHETIVVSRHPEDIQYTLTPNLPSLKADAASYDELMDVIPEDTDVLVNSLIPDPFMHETFSAWCQNVIQCCKDKGIKRLVAIGDACVFKVRPDMTIRQTTFLTPMYREWFGEHEKTHEIYLKEEELAWQEIVPAAKCLPHKQLKEYMISVDSLCTIDPLVKELKTPDPNHYPFADNSFISIQDFAYAVLDEIEQAKYVRQRICVAWKQGQKMYWEGGEEHCG